MCGHAEKTIRYKVRLAISYGPENQKLMISYSENLCTEGIFIETAQILPIDTLVSSEFVLPGKQEPIICRARVSWTNEPGNRKKSSLPGGMGLQFINLSVENIEAIREFLDADRFASAGLSMKEPTAGSEFILD